MIIGLSTTLGNSPCFPAVDQALGASTFVANSLPAYSWYYDDYCGQVKQASRQRSTHRRYPGKYSASQAAIAVSCGDGFDFCASCSKWRFAARKEPPGDA